MPLGGTVMRRPLGVIATAFRIFALAFAALSLCIPLLWPLWSADEASAETLPANGCHLEGTASHDAPGRISERMQAAVFSSSCSPPPAFFPAALQSLR